MGIERSIVFAFKAPAARKKLLLGGLFFLLFFTVFLAFVVVGYIMRVFCNALEGRDVRLPEWTDYRTLFNEGLEPMLIILAYYSPVIGLSIIEIQLVSAHVPVSAFFPIHLVLMLIVSILLPLALIRSITIGTSKAAFDFGRIFEFIKSNTGTYFKAWALACAVCIAAGIVALVVLIGAVGLGALGGKTALTLGLVAFAFAFTFVSFVANLIIVHLYAQTYRASTPFVDDTEGEIRASMAVPPPLRK